MGPKRKLRNLSDKGFQKLSEIRMHSIAKYLVGFGTVLLIVSVLLCVTSASVGFLSSEGAFTSAAFVCGFCAVIQSVLALYGSREVRENYGALVACKIFGVTNLCVVVIGVLVNLDSWTKHADNCTLCGKIGSETRCSWFCDFDFKTIHELLTAWLTLIGFLGFILFFITWSNVCRG